MLIIRKGHVWPQKNIILNCHTIPQLNPALNCHVIADGHVVLDKCIGANIAIFANACPRQHNGELPNLRVITNV